VQGRKESSLQILIPISFLIPVTGMLIFGSSKMALILFTVLSCCYVKIFVSVNFFLLGALMLLVRRSCSSLKVRMRELSEMYFEKCGQRDCVIQTACSL